MSARPRPFMPKAGHQQLPEDITGPLRLPPGSPGLVVCWSQTPIDAARRLRLLGLLDETNPRDLVEAPTAHTSITLLDRAQDWHAGKVLAAGLFGDSPIVSVDSGFGPRRVVTVIGQFTTCRVQAELDRPVATDAQTNAALAVLPRWVAWVLGEHRVRGAVTAALRASR